MCRIGLKMNLCIREGSDLKVIRPQTSSGCWHLLQIICSATFGIIWQDVIGEVKVGALVLGIVGSLMRIWNSCPHPGTIPWLHEGSQFSKPQHHPSFAIFAQQTESWADRCCLLQLCCSCGRAYLDNFRLSAKMVHTQSYSSVCMQITIR